MKTPADTPETCQLAISLVTTQSSESGVDAEKHLRYLKVHMIEI